MKKIFDALVIFCFTLCTVFCTQHALATCSQKAAETMTGAACSIKELNLGKNKTAQDSLNISPIKERNLRPVKINSKVQKSDGDNCILGMCLYRNILEGKFIK